MSRKRILLLSLSVAVLLALAVAALLVTRIDLAALTQRLEVNLSTGFDQQVKVLGQTRLHFWPRPQAVFTDTVMGEGETESLRVPRATAVIAWLPLLHGQLKASNLTLEEPILTVRRAANGSFTPHWKRKRPTTEPGQEQPPLPVTKVTVKRGTIRGTDRVTDSVAELDDVAMELVNFYRDTNGRLAFSGEVRAERLRVNRIEMQQVRGTLSAENGVYRADPMRGTLCGGEATFSLETDLSGAHPAWRLELAADGLSLAELFRSLAGRVLYEGKVDLRMRLSATGPGRLVHHLDGTVDVAGKQVVQHGFDLDGFVSSLRKSHQVNPVDVGAYLVVGPVGTLLSRSFDLANLYRQLQEEKSQAIDQLSFDWEIENGMARAKDVALRTRENRVAVQGAIDLPRLHYDGIILAVLDNQGCAELTEKISGALVKPSIQPFSILNTLAGPLAWLLNKFQEIVDPGECRPFYEGSVAHPRSP